MSIQGGLLSQEVSNLLMEKIIQGEYQPGDKLPAERKLAENLEVSRTVIREAIKILEEKGLVIVRAGKGVYVRQLTSQTITESVSLLFHMRRGTLTNLIEVRKFLEIPLAGMAAVRRKPENLAEMRSALEAMDQLYGQAHPYIIADLRFHQAIAHATQNPLFALLIDPILELTQKKRALITSAPRSYQRSQSHHRSVYAAIEAGDPKAAEAAMAAHLAQVEEDTYLLMPELLLAEE